MTDEEPWFQPASKLLGLVAAAAGSFDDLDRLWPEIDRMCRRLRRLSINQWRDVHAPGGEWQHEDDGDIWFDGEYRCDTRDVTFKLAMQELVRRVQEGPAFKDQRAEDMRMQLFKVASGRWKPDEPA